MRSGDVSEMLNLPWAARIQRDTVIADYDLARYARELRPGVRWWWGVRSVGHHRGAFCYLCGAMVAVWDTRYPLTETARAVVIAHRDAEHVAPPQRGRTEG